MDMPQNLYQFAILAIAIIVVVSLIVIMLRKPGQPVPAADPATLPPPSDAVKQLAASGKKIEAIKQYRSETGLGLSEAKSAVEAL
jgi:ribosomal protein L7/L12